MYNSLLNELTERAECYFDDELIWWKNQHKGKLLLFSSARFVQQFIDESKEVRKRSGLKARRYSDITFEVQENDRYLKIY